MLKMERHWRWFRDCSPPLHTHAHTYHPPHIHRDTIYTRHRWTGEGSRYQFLQLTVWERIGSQSLQKILQGTNNFLTRVECADSSISFQDVPSPPLLLKLPKVIHLEQDESQCPKEWRQVNFFWHNWTQSLFQSFILPEHRNPMLSHSEILQKHFVTWRLHGGDEHQTLTGPALPSSGIPHSCGLWVFPSSVSAHHSPLQWLLLR